MISEKRTGIIDLGDSSHGSVTLIARPGGPQSRRDRTVVTEVLGRTAQRAKNRALFEGGGGGGSSRYIMHR